MEEPKSLSDAEMVELLRSQPVEGWKLFLDRYSARIYGLFRHWGLSHAEAGTCFVTLCRELLENDFQLFSRAPDLTAGGTLFAWLRGLARTTALDWARTETGQARIESSLSGLSDLQQQISRLYFHHGLPPPQIRTRLESELGTQFSLVDILEQLEEILQRLTSDRLWRLLSQLARRRPADSETAAAAPPEVPQDRHQEFERLWQAWAALDSRTALILQLRYDDCQSAPQIALITGLTEEQTLGSIHSGLLRLRRSVSPGSHPGAA